MVTITKEAARRFKEIRSSQNRPDAAIRVAVVGGDRAGLAYHIGLEDFRASNDLAFESKGVRIFLDHTSSPYLLGCEIDWLETGDEAGFTISIPNRGGDKKKCCNRVEIACMAFNENCPKSAGGRSFGK